VKDYAAKIIQKINDKRTTQIIDKDDQLKDDVERDLEPGLRKKRRKERKHDFVERIHLLTIKELMPK
jgi:hypothetical protein